MVLKKLMQLNDELRQGFTHSHPFEGPNTADRDKFFQSVINYYGSSRDLLQWLANKFPDYVTTPPPQPPEKITPF